MPELLLELFSEEIPARLQPRAADDLRRLVADGLEACGLEIGEAEAFATPQRLALVIDDVPAKSPAVSEERKGPRVGAPEAAVQGFLRAAGLASLSKAEVIKDEKKGDYYVTRTKKQGRKASEIIAEVVTETVVQFPWPKSMRFNRFLDTGNGTELRWIRPLHSIVCLLDGKVVPFEIAGLKTGKTTRGHRFLGNKPFAVTGFADYRAKLQKHKVILDAARRAEIIADEARAFAKDAKLALVEDEALLVENAGLTEWPVVLMGAFDKSFLEVPAECLTTAMKVHQKCFSLREPRSKKLANKFLVVSNLKARDGGKQIVAGNEKVIAARLSDAKFFWEQDLKRPLDEMANALDGITFHEKLGSQKERVERIAELAFQIAGSVDAVPEDARRAAQLCKADLVSGMVGEFPELQGLMGRYYAEVAGAKPEIARAIELHYKPKGPTDTVPKEDEGDAVSLAVALADKLDTLVGFWAIGEKPTGSGDPYQLRRAALGFIRIVLENDLRLSLIDAIVPGLAPILTKPHFQKVKEQIRTAELLEDTGVAEQLFEKVRKKYLSLKPAIEFAQETLGNAQQISQDLLVFFADRLKIHLREKGARHDLIDAVFSLGGQDDLALIVKRVEALGEFLKTEDGANLLTGVKRAQNILTIEEKKDKTNYAGTYGVALLKEKEELALAAAIESVKYDTAAAINVENFAGAMRALAELRAPVDAFFDHVTVNTDDAVLRKNRLHLLSDIRTATLNVADFTKIAG
ncbi:MAG: glycine--tRNA ligase subunit beta [Hyphomicrobium sp.]